MTEWEINDIIENLPYLDRNLWEAARFSSYITLLPNSKKNLKITDILKFKWDVETNDKDEREITKADISRLKEKAKSISNLMKKI